MAKGTAQKAANQFNYDAKVKPEDFLQKNYHWDSDDEFKAAANLIKERQKFLREQQAEQRRKEKEAAGPKDTPNRGRFGTHRRGGRHKKGDDRTKEFNKVVADVHNANGALEGRIQSMARERAEAEAKGNKERVKHLDQRIRADRKAYEKATVESLREHGFTPDKHGAFIEEARTRVGRYVEDNIDAGRRLAGKKPQKRNPKGLTVVDVPDDNFAQQAKTKTRQREEELVGFTYRSNRTREENEEAFQDLRKKYLDKHGLAADTSNISSWKVSGTKWWGRTKDRLIDGDKHDKVGQRLAQRPGIISGFWAMLRGLNARVRFFAILGLMVGVLFIPVDYFTFTGWAIAALAMTLLSGIYAIIVNGFKLVAATVIGLGNTLFTFVGAYFVQAVEGILSWGIFKVPEVRCDIPGGEVDSNFCSGREILADGLIPAGALNALNVGLMDPESFMPKVRGTTLFESLVRFFGFENFSLGFGVGLNNLLNKAVDGSNPYLLMVFLLVPLVLGGWALWKYLLKPHLQNAGAIA